MDNLSIPASSALDVTPSDTTDLTGCRAIFVGGAGTLVVKMLNPTRDSSVEFECPAGILLPIRVQRVMAATDATAIVALF